jgi:hypothetical protein
MDQFTPVLRTVKMQHKRIWQVELVEVAVDLRGEDYVLATGAGVNYIDRQGLANQLSDCASADRLGTPVFAKLFTHKCVFSELGEQEFEVARADTSDELGHRLWQAAQICYRSLRDDEAATILCPC